MDGSFSSKKQSDLLLTYLKGLQRESGGFADTVDGKNSIRATLSVVKASLELEDLIHDDKIVDFIDACRHSDGGFAIDQESDATAYDTAVALITLKALGSELALTYLPSGLEYMKKAAKTQFDYFMMIAAYEECEVKEAVPSHAIDFFSNLLEVSIAQGSITNTAIAASALIRGGSSLSNPEIIIQMLQKGQNTVEGGFGENDEASLFTTYCVMRTLLLFNTLPNTKRLLEYLDGLETNFGYTDGANHPTSAGAIYQNLSMRTWLKQLQCIPVESARLGDVDQLKTWLMTGGLINHYDSHGWNPLLAASARGMNQVVDLLLNHGFEGISPANVRLRYLEADALPIYMAGQSGDLKTVQLLLQADPASLHAISSVNGHTVLLQAAFYGKAKHLILAQYLLDHAAMINDLPEELLEQEQIKLLSATNVRGYNAITMQDLWHNEQMKSLLEGYAHDHQVSEVYYKALMLDIASPNALTEKMMETITFYLESEDTTEAERLINSILAAKNFDINGLGGPLQMTPLIYALTGVDVGNAGRKTRRYTLTKMLLEAGASPIIREKHPMGVGPVIRASVLNNFNLLQLLADYMTEEAFTNEMNVSPAVNGLTAMHDAVHRGLTAPPEELEQHLAQIKWMLDRGASIHLPDHTGQTVADLATRAQEDSAFPRTNVTEVFNIIENY